MIDALMLDTKTQDACEQVMRSVTRIAGLKMFQVIQFMVQEQNEECSRLRTALIDARKALVECGFCGAGKHGTGDPEINQIDAVVSKHV